MWSYFDPFWACLQFSAFLVFVSILHMLLDLLTLQPSGPSGPNLARHRFLTASHHGSQGCVDLGPKIPRKMTLEVRARAKE